MRRLALFIALLVLSSLSLPAVVPSDLRCELLRDPLGVDGPNPRLSWKLSEEKAVRGQKQTAWEIRAAGRPELLADGASDLWNSGLVKSSQSAHVAYGGPPPISNQTVFWQVRVHDKDGNPSAWSEPARFTMGLLKPYDWKGPWIHHPDAPAEKHIWFRRNLTLDQPLQSAIIHVASIGYHELFINGKKAADHHLAPAASRLDRRALYLSYDIAKLLQPGENTIALWQGPGWARYGFFKTRPALRIQMNGTLADGKALALSSDTQWRCTVSSSGNIGGWQYSNMGGEQIDARLHRPDWNLPDFDDSAWATPMQGNINVELSAQMMEPTRVIESIPAKSIVRKDDGWRFDMGKNFTGWLELRMRGLSAGDPVTIQIANRESEVEDFLQKSIFISAGGTEEVFRHRFNYIAGRYVTITGLKSEPRTEDLTGLALSTDLRRTGSFSSSNELFNRIYETDLWTWRANLIEGYTADCPHRERLGYGEVAFACAWGIAFPNYDSGAMYQKHVRDWSDMQEANGWIHHTAPQCNQHYGGPLWSSAGTHIAWAHYETHGDPRILETIYPTTKRWLAFLHANTEDGLLKKYNKHWGRFLGEWAAPDHVRGEGDPALPRYFNNCVYALNLKRFVAMAEALRHKADADLYRTRLEALKKRIHETYYNAGQKTYSSGRQVQLAFALLADIPPKELRPTIEESFQRELRAKPYLDMGSSGLPILLNYLTEHASSSKAVFDHLNRTTQPGYGYFLERGESAWPEYWSVDVPSRIHTCYTGIASWFTKSLAGIRPDPDHPGFQSFLIQPVVAGDLTFSEAQTESLYGTIRSRWERQGDRFTLEVTIPPNSQATIRIPTSDPTTVTENGKSLTNLPGIEVLPQQNGHITLHAGSGTYQFSSILRP